MADSFILCTIPEINFTNLIRYTVCFINRNVYTKRKTKAIVFLICVYELSCTSFEFPSKMTLSLLALEPLNIYSNNITVYQRREAKLDFVEKNGNSKKVRGMRK